MTGLWSLLVPTPGTQYKNWARVPSAEGAALVFGTPSSGFIAYGAGASVAQSSIQARFGRYSCRVTATVDERGLQYTENTFTGATGPYYVSFYLWTPLTSMKVWLYDAATPRYAATVTTTANAWQRIVLGPYTLTNAGQVALYALLPSTQGDATTWYVDGVMICSANVNYFDGDAPGCMWTGIKSQSASITDGVTLDYGPEVNLDTYSTYVMAWPGAGLPPIEIVAADLPADQPGSQYQATKVKERTLQLVVRSQGSSLSNLHYLRRELTDALHPGSPVTLYYTGASKKLSIRAYYAGGLEYGEKDGFTEAIGLRFYSSDPFWTEDTAQVATLDNNDSVTNTDYLAGRINGAWVSLGGSTTNGTIYAIVAAPDGTVYAGGTFTTIGGVSANRVAKWNGSAWSALGTGAGGSVYALLVHPSGDLYAAGAFTAIGGVTTKDIARWDGANWNALGSGGADGGAQALAYDPALGYLYVGGSFTQMGGIANTAKIARWTGAAWQSITAAGACNNNVQALAVSPGSVLYAGGVFTSINGISVNRVAQWNGTSWSSLGMGFNAGPQALLYDPRGYLYCAGQFTLDGAGVVTLNHIARWNGTVWEQLTSGLDSHAWSLALDASGVLYVAGQFTTAGGKTLPGRIAAWDGTGWRHLDTVFAGTPVVNTVAANGDDLYIGYDAAGPLTASGRTVVTNSGTRKAFPVITITGPGTLWWIENQTTRERLYFDLTLVSGETVTIDLRPGHKTVTGGWRGNLYYQMLPQSDFSTFGLAPGANTVACYVSSPSSTTVVAWWEPVYWGADV